MRHLTFRLSIASFGFATSVAFAEDGHEHEGDFVIGVTGSGQLRFEFDEQILGGEEFIQLLPIDPPTPGVFEGWTSDAPGFDHLHVAEPTEDFYPMLAGASIYLMGIDLDAALYVRSSGLGSPVAISPTPALGSLLIGDEELHTHGIWHVDSLAAGFDPLQTQWQGTFKFADLGSTGYADSNPFTLTFTNVPEPTSIGILALGSLLVFRRRHPEV
jgi:hypothetical protein